jgi:Lamin Tail Domain
MRRPSVIALAVSLPLALGTLLAPAVASAVPKATPATSSAVRIGEVLYNSPGRDNGSNASVNQEWVELVNTTNHKVSIRHWSIKDHAGHVYMFGNFSLGAHGAVLVHTGKGPNHSINRFWGRTSYAWNNTKDTATLRNAGGAVKDTCSYNDPHHRRIAKKC